MKVHPFFYGFIALGVCALIATVPVLGAIAAGLVIITSPLFIVWK